MANVEKDSVSGQTTTGHEWDGIKELNTPLPSWWVWVFYATIVWAIGYWVVYPSIPTASTHYEGMAGWNARSALDQELAAAEEARSGWMSELKASSLAEIVEDPELMTYARAGGGIAFADNCAPCHGAGGAGNPGYPTLGDDAWIWGGTLDEIQTTITHGIRNESPESRASQMPPFGYLSDQDQQAIASYVAAMASGNASEGMDGQEQFVNNCGLACHGEDGSGQQMIGSPPLNDQIWLCPGRDTCVPEVSVEEHVMRQMANPKHGVMPAWSGRLDETTIKMLTVYVHRELGGGQ